MWPSPPAPITTVLVPAPSIGIAFLTAWIAVRPASASAAIAAGSSDGSSLTTERALVCRNSAKPPSRPMPGNSPLTQCMSSPLRHGTAQPAGDERVHDHGVADLDVGHAGADLVDPARVLVAGHVGQDDLRTSPPTGPPGCAGRCGRGRRRRSSRSRRTGRAIFGSSISSTFRASWYSCSRAAFMRPLPPPAAHADCQQQIAAHAAVGLQATAHVRLAMRLNRGSSSAVTGVPSPLHERGRRAPASIAQRPAQLAAALGVGPRQLAERRARRVATTLEQPPLRGRRAPCAETARAARPARPRVSPGNASAKPSPRATRRR